MKPLGNNAQKKFLRKRNCNHIPHKAKVDKKTQPSNNKQWNKNINWNSVFFLTEILLN